VLPPPRIEYRIVKVSALYNLTADPTERDDVSDEHPDVFQALHRRVITKYWAGMARARVVAIDDAAFTAWRKNGNYVGPWTKSSKLSFCSTMTRSRQLYEAEIGLGNCSLPP